MRRSGPAAGDLVHQIVAVLDRAAVDGGDDVARLEPALVGWAAGLNFLHQHAVLEAVDAIDGAGQSLVRNWMPMEPRVTLWLGLIEIVVDRDHGVRRHGEADALVAGRLRVDGRVDADYFAVHVQQRAAGVAGIDGRVGLDEVLELAARAGLDGAVLGGDDAGGHGLRQRKRAADGFNPVAHLRVVGVAQLHGGQGGVGIDLDHGQIGCLVDADDARRDGRGPACRDRWKA